MPFWGRKQKGSEDPAALTALARALEKDGNKAAAEDLYRRAAEADDAEAIYRLSMLLRRRGARDDAARLADRALGLGHRIAMFDRASSLGDSAEAEAWFQRAAEAGHPLAAKRAEQVRAALDQQDSRTRELRADAEAGNSDAWFQLSGHLLGQGRREEAERAMQHAVDAGSWQAMWRRGDVAFSGGDHDEAERWYRRAANAGARYPLPVLYLARFLASRGGTDEAIDLLVWLKDHSDIEVMGELAAVHQRRGEPEQAEQWLRRGAEADEEACRVALGALLAERGESEEAERWYRTVIATDDSSPDARVGLAALLERRGELDEATALYRQAGDAGDPEALVALGRLAEQRGDLDEAEELYFTATDEQPRAMLLLARLLESRGQIAEAADWYLQAADAGVTEADL
jgi:tetratricopeptide (TPR) repeat protein